MLKRPSSFCEKNVKSGIESGFLKKGEDIAKSDIFYALKDFASGIKDYEAKRKIVILASDMLENSAITSFYGKNAVRGIDSVKELAKVEKEGLITDFGETEVYVIGVGLTANQKKLCQSKNFKLT